jgi:hypothetical protein
MNTVSKITVGCILAILVVVISSPYSMIQAQLMSPPTIHHECREMNGQFHCVSLSAQIMNGYSNIPEIRACQMLHATWNPVRSDTIQSNNSTAQSLFVEKNCLYELGRDPFSGADMCKESGRTYCNEIGNLYNTYPPA